MPRPAGRSAGERWGGFSCTCSPAPSSWPPCWLAEANLTDREAEVLRLVAQGRSNAEIAAELFLGVETVKTHVRNVLAKLGARDRVQAVITAYESGFIR